MTKVIPEKNFPRQDFYHWVLIDVPATLDRLPEGKASKGVIEKGKPFGKTEYGIAGQNDYKKVSEGLHGNYDGPCPPWNDEAIHHYHFIIYALDVGTLSPPKGPFDGRQAMRRDALAYFSAGRSDVGTKEAITTESCSTTAFKRRLPAVAGAACASGVRR